MSKQYFYVKTGSSWKQAPGTFIFSLRNKENLPPFKAPALEDVKHTGSAIFTHNTYGPLFGERNDIYISDYAGSSTISESSISTYQAPSGVSDPYTILAGTHYFQPSEVEVFHIV
jgi:hypothetical protein